MKVLGIIPARGGSKGVPRKNIKLLDGKPLINYTYDAAKGSLLLSRVVLSSEDKEIIEHAHNIGLEVPYVRPKELATDTASTLSVIQDIVMFMERQGFTFDAICILQVTNPFRRSSDIDNAIKVFMEKGSDSLVSVLPVPYEYNPHWCFESDDKGLLRISTGETNIIPRRQELPVAYHRDGSIYIVRRNVLINMNSLYGNNISYYVSDINRHVNIDTIDDWAKAEAMINKINIAIV